MKKLLLLLLIISLSISSICLTSCEKKEESPLPKTKNYYDLFNTVSTFYSYADDSEDEFKENSELAYNTLREYHRLFDIYYEYDGINNLATVNRMAGEGPVKVDERLIDFLLFAKEMYVLTNGRTNIALGGVLSLWHDAREGMDLLGNSVPPDRDKLIDASHHTSIDSIIIDREASTVEITDSALSIDVGAIGKGYAVERAKEVLVSKGVTSYVLNVGGNIATIGTKTKDQGWKTAIKNPNDPTSYSLYVELSDTSCVTSGSYERYFTYEGKRYHHLIDPDTLMPAEYFGSVTVITEDSGLADALSTALFLMSYEDGLSLVESLKGVEAVWIFENGEVRTSPGVKTLS